MILTAWCVYTGVSDGTAVPVGFAFRERVRGVSRPVSDPVELAYAEFYVQLVRLARQLVDDTETAEEVVQEVFLRLQRRPDAAGLTYPYLRTAVLNQARSILRRRRLVRRVPTFRGQQWVNDPAGDAADRDQMMLAIAGLPLRQRQVVVMRYYEDLSLRDIADALRISVNATSAALSRALQSLSSIVRSDDER